MSGRSSSTLRSKASAHLRRDNGAEAGRGDFGLVARGMRPVYGPGLGRKTDRVPRAAA